MGLSDGDELVVAVGVLCFFGVLAFLGWLAWMQMQKSEVIEPEVRYVSLSEVERVAERIR